MWYVEVLVADVTYHRDRALTYTSKTKLAPGKIVVVPLQKKETVALVTAIVSKPKFATKEVTRALDLPALPDTSVKLIDWLRGYYPAPLGTIVQLFLAESLTKPSTKSMPMTSKLIPSGQLPPLTDDQSTAVGKMQSPGLHLLHGETGTGKTRVYIELARKCLKQGRSSIILTPEIGLTSQLADSFRGTFGDRVVILHSGLTETVRREVWQKLLKTEEAFIVIGARSALFCPLRNIGLIVVDEAHETAYKQDQAPYYQTSTVAAKLASLHNATLVLGSATPLVKDYYIANAKQRPIIRMTQVAAGNPGDGANIELIDLKDRAQFTKSPHLSVPLLEAIKQRLQSQEQTLLFLNRRGTARVIFCENCSWQATCPHCDLPLVYHGDDHLMRCHSCSYKAATPPSCPTCTSTDIIFRSIGTKAIVDEVQRLFPAALIMRFDTDNKKVERLEAHYEELKAGGVDIIVGTQTLAKGLDLPKLSLVGVVAADSSLYFPDFSAQERTYQLLSQVLGRIGRGHRQGSAIIQTYSPNSALMRSITTRNWNVFYNRELSERRQFLFPPFCYLIKVTCKRTSNQSAQKAATALHTKIRNLGYSVLVEGPTPSFHEKIQNKFAWQLIIKSKRRDYLSSIIKSLPSGWSYDIDPMNLL